MKVSGADPDYTAFWRWLIEVAHEISQNNVVVTYFSVMLPEQVLANVEALAYFDGVHFLYLKTVVDATRPLQAVESDVRDWIVSHLDA